MDLKILSNNTRVTNQDLLGYYEYIRYSYNLGDNTIEAMKCFREAYHLTDDKKLEQAIEEYTKAIQLKFDYYEALDNRAFCYMNLGDFEKAKKDFEKSLQIERNNFIAVFSLGECCYKLKNNSLAKKYFQKAIKMRPKHTKTKEYLALLKSIT